MDVTQLTFGIKDVVAIVIGVISIVSFFYALKRSSEKSRDAIKHLADQLNEHKTTVEEKFIHAKGAKKANIQSIMDTIDKQKDEFEKKESQIYTRINEIRQEQQEAHEKLWIKLDRVEKMTNSMNSQLSELTGFLKALKLNT